jgi:hypothetical protein
MRLLLLALLAVLPLGVVAADPPPPAAVSRVVNPDDTRRRLGLLPDYADLPRLKDVRVAVLDSGFAGADGKRPYLPAGAVVVEHYAKGFVEQYNLGDPEFSRPLDAGNPHGRHMAQLVWAVTGSHPDGPQFFLLNANGPTMFRRAVRFAIELKVDVILFSGTFEGAGDYDGRGPVNAAVGEAVAAGILWVNAAGNHGGRVFNGPVDVGTGGWLRFGPAGVTGLRFRNRLDENAVTLTLTWNDYRDAEDAGTEKDLDLFVEDSRGRVVGSSELRQVGPGRPAGEGETKNPRERLVLTDLAAGEYRVRVRAKSANFGPGDRLRLLVTPARDVPLADPATGKPLEAVEFLDATRGGEIYPPADHPGVLTVGAADPASSVGPTADGRVKPDVVVAEAVARFTNGEEVAGSSVAAAEFAGVAAALRAAEPGLTAVHVREWVAALDRTVAKPAVARAAMPEVPPVPVFVPLSPNQARALRYSAFALDEKRRRGDPDPSVLMSTPGGSYVIRPTPPPLAASRPTVPPQAMSPSTIHAPWVTPPRRALAELVRGGR